MAIRQLMPEPPDVVLSGVNSGLNIGDFVNYSGTVAGAMEGMLLGAKSIALSQAYDFDGDRKVPWRTAETLGPKVLRKLLAQDFPRGTFFNVNFPKCAPEEVVGTQVVSQGKYVHSLYIEKRRDGRSFPYYWMRFQGESPAHQPGTDIYAISENKIAVSPLKMDLTNHEFLTELQNSMNEDGT